MPKMNAYNLTKQISKSANELLEDILKSQEQVGNRLETIKKLEFDSQKKKQNSEPVSDTVLEGKSVEIPVEPAAESKPKTRAKTASATKEEINSAQKTDETSLEKSSTETQAEPIKPRVKKQVEKTVEPDVQTDKTVDAQVAAIQPTKAPVETVAQDTQNAATDVSQPQKPTGQATYKPGYPRSNPSQGNYNQNRPTGQRTYNNQQQTGFTRPNTNQPGTYNNQQQTGFTRPNTNQPGTYNNQQQTGFTRPNTQQGTYNQQQTGFTRPNTQQGTYNNQNNFNRTPNTTGQQQGQSTYANRPAGQRTYNNQSNFNRTPNATGQQTGFVRNNNQQNSYNNQGGFNRNSSFQNNSGDGQTGFNRNSRPGGTQNRPGGQQGGFNKSSGYNNQKGKGQAGSVLAPPVEKERVSNYDPNKSVYDNKKFDYDKKASSRKLILNKVQQTEEESSRYHKGRKKKPLEQKVFIEPIIIDKATITGDTLTIKEFSEKIGKPSSDIIKKLLLLGIMATINNEIDYDTATLIANEYGIELEQKIDKTYEEVMIDAYDDTADVDGDAISRPPVVTIMGHVDHGKTSLLDFIRRSSVVKSEAGGITQHIGAYTVDVNSKIITFLDTPGHEAFTSMRARGAQVTDIAILVVAADDGVMPQTIEAINHAKAAGVPILVAITKIDKPNSDIERVKQQLTEQLLVPEEWGGETIIVPLSSKTGEGIPQLLDMILLLAEVQELKADPTKSAKGAIIEAQLDKGRGPVATVLIQNGTLHTGDTIIAGIAYGRVRFMLDDKGNKVDTAGPSVPVEVIGFSEVPEAGDTLYVVGEDKLSKQVAEERRDKIKADQLKTISKVTLDDLFTHISEGSIKELAIVIKADVQGSAEAIKQSLEKLSNENVHVRVIHSGVGAITKHDILLATASHGIIIGFNVRPDQSARTSPDFNNVDIRTYRIIYNAIEDVEKAMKGLLDPVFKEVILGHVEVRQTFKVSSIGTIAGCYVQDGKVTNNSSVRVLRDGIVIHEGTIDTLKRFKDDAKEVASGYECGIGIKNFNDVKEGDIFELYADEEVVSD